MHLVRGGHRGQEQTRKGLECEAEGMGSAIRKCLLATQEGWSREEAVPGAREELRSGLGGCQEGTGCCVLAL